MGTPVADLVGKSGDYLAKSIPIPTCPSQDDSGIPSLTLKNQINWLAKSNRAFNHNINMYSIVSLSKNKNTSKIFKSTHYYLNKTQGANDGQVAGSSQILPNSSLLGYFNADHWAIILPFKNTDKNKLNSKNKIIKNLASKNKFPREALLESIVILLDKKNQTKVKR
ncbi:hypothetical protein DR996_27825 [Vibrio owensii]|nr:hypothetical protein DR996_27825 [Vibrio owensii]